MAQHKIEVELRGPLEEREYAGLISLLSKREWVITRENRFLIDYSTFLEGIGERKLDVRVRRTNGKVELIVKRGVFGGPAREEAAVEVANGALEEAISFLALLGYTKGVACDRGITRYSLPELEIAIQDVRIFGSENRLHSRFFEAEVMSDESGKAAAEQQLRGFLTNAGMRVFEVHEWNAYVELINEKANGVFDFSTDSVSSLRHLGLSPSVA